MENEVKGIITVAGQSFQMSGSHGFGLITLDGKKTLVQFSCPLESIPPKGSGIILGQTGINLSLINGSLHYGNALVYEEIK